jgi:hypothetical protein
VNHLLTVLGGPVAGLGCELLPEAALANGRAGKPLVLAFAREHLPACFDEVRQIFSKRGAYRRFRDLLLRRNALDQWYEFKEKATEQALRDWCEDNSITLAD